jgi:hypothetical protein
MKLSGIFLFFFLMPLIGLAQTPVTPEIITTLSPDMNETSGLANLDGAIWTHNDSGGQPELYQIDTIDGSVTRTVTVSNATNIDWEDIATDGTSLYIGDFGNNNGDRTNLRIYKVLRSDIASADVVTAEIIDFEYSDQTSWIPAPNNNDFDCEAMIAWNDSLYLFSKNWTNQQTKQYVLTRQPGTQTAQLQGTFDVAGLVTGATMIPSSQALVLVGYAGLTGSTTWLFTGFTGSNFFSGNFQTFPWTLFAQCEGVCVRNNTSVYITSEEFPFPLSLDPTLFALDLPVSVSIPDVIIREPIPRIWYADTQVFIELTENIVTPVNIQILNLAGKSLKTDSYSNNSSQKTPQILSIPISLPTGLFLVRINDSTYPLLIINSFK